MNSKAIITAVLAAVLQVSGVNDGHSSSKIDEELRGLKEVVLSVAAFPPHAWEGETEWKQLNVELLREATRVLEGFGLTVSTRGPAPTLAIFVEGSFIDDLRPKSEATGLNTLLVCTTEVALSEPVALARKPTPPVWAVVWSRSNIGIKTATRDEFRRFAKEEVVAYSKECGRDWRFVQRTVE